LIHGTAFAVRGLLAAGLAPDDDWVAAGLNWLALHQQPSGGWGELAVTARADAKTDNYLSGGATASQTAWALLALVAAGRANDVAARRGVEFLLETQEDDGRWREPHFVLRDARSKRWLRNELHIVAWPLSALSRWAVSAAAIQADGTDSIELRIVGSAADG
jgi:squalene-hopene/tetraprenyl-beta-curcumene cyclase